MKYAILSLDIEDWYHVDYFARKKCDRTYSMLDGLDGYLKIIEAHQVPSSFFVLGELIPKIKTKLQKISQLGHEIGLHICPGMFKSQNEVIDEILLEADTFKKYYGFKIRNQVIAHLGEDNCKGYATPYRKSHIEAIINDQ